MYFTNDTIILKEIMNAGKKGGREEEKEEESYL